MARYLATFTGMFVIVFVFAWVFLSLNFDHYLPAVDFINLAHNRIVEKCDLGNFDVLGNSEANADVMPSRIGPDMRVLGLTAGTPVETYYIAKRILKCPNHPHAVLLLFNPAALGSAPMFPAPEKTAFWEEAFTVPWLNYAEIQKYSQQFNATIITGPPSLFGLDFRIKAILYRLNCPAYWGLYLQHIVHLEMQPKVLKEFYYKNNLLYSQTMLDGGHHFYGFRAEAGAYLPDGKGGFMLDHDAYRVDDKIDPFEDFYLRRTIHDLTTNGINVYYVDAPMNNFSVVHYPPDLIPIFQNYLAKLEAREPGFQVIGSGFPAWQPVLFGDRFHLNLRGSLIFSDYIRRALIAAGRSDVTYSDADLKPANLYTNADGGNFFTPIHELNDPGEISPASDIPPPPVAYPVNASALLVKQGVQAPSLDLAANGIYAAGIFIKNINAAQASLQVSWPGGFAGTVQWNYGSREITYSGNANQLDSGVAICPGGWIELFLSVNTGVAPGPYQGPKIFLSGTNASAYLYDMTLEHGLWPANYCTAQSGEAPFIMPAENTYTTTTSALARPLAGG